MCKCAGAKIARYLGSSCYRFLQYDKGVWHWLEAALDTRQGKGTSSCSLHESAVDFQPWQRCTPPCRGLVLLTLDCWVGGVHIYLHRRQLFASISYTGSENLQMYTSCASGFLVICMAVSLAVSKRKIMPWSVPSWQRKLGMCS
jgi:hypothetical protein